ncbi:MAG TPA: sialate O-acetylesterase [Prolixibacteraceae bacterium]|jgi:sialate O-acetylesterase|nr:sialate O-acetylesterase [Prolixibacteraceae bacterium]
MKRSLIILLVFSLFSINMYGKIILPSVFGDNMVLQQNSNVAIWGWSDPGETIRIVTSWSKDTVKVKADNTSKWTTSIKTITAGGPYSIQILGNNKVQLNNVMLGEVWICSGQSNMEMSVNWKLINGEEEAAQANNPNIRIFHVQKIGAPYPQQNCNANWSVCSPESMRATSATGYFFARELQQKLNVPVGIIVAAWGGTPAEVWIEKSLIENNPVLNKSKYTEHFDGWPGDAGTLYNSMIAPFVPYGIAGAIWYQGESNCGNYPIYSMLMKTLIESWRADFKKDFPFYFVQIAPYTYGPNGKAEYLREQQELASKTIPKSGMVVISDLVDNVKDIHPKNKLDVGKRLAAYALSETYKQNMGEYKSPSFESMNIVKDKVHITFSHATEGLRCTGKSPSKFMIAGEDQKFIPGTAKIEGNTVTVSSKLVKAPVAVRFCFDDSTTPDIFSNYGLPVAPFRTDKW